MAGVGVRNDAGGPEGSGQAGPGADRILLVDAGQEILLCLRLGHWMVGRGEFLFGVTDEALFTENVRCMGIRFLNGVLQGSFDRLRGISGARFKALEGREDGSADASFLLDDNAWAFFSTSLSRRSNAGGFVPFTVCNGRMSGGGLVIARLGG